MNDRQHPDMLETAEPPGAGWITEAIAFLRRMFRGAPDTTSDTLGDTADAPEGGGSWIIDGVPATVTETDLQLTAPAEPVFGTDVSSQPAGAMEELVQPHQPAVLHSLLDPITRTDSEPGTGDLAKSPPTPDVAPDSGRFGMPSGSSRARPSGPLLMSLLM